MTKQSVMPRLVSTACAFVLLALSACQQPSSAAFFNRGAPESLLDVSSEVVNLSTGGKDQLRALSDWVAKDKPSHVELYCNEKFANCKEAKRILTSNAIPTNVIASGNNTAMLFYERIVARDCNPRYLDTGTSMYNESAPSFGCSLSANIVQHVSNKRDFINPNISDDPSATAAVGALRKAYDPATSRAAQSAQKSMTGSFDN